VERLQADVEEAVMVESVTASLAFGIIVVVIAVMALARGLKRRARGHDPRR
jgi:uncharacterized protein (DUF2062 family)